MKSSMFLISKSSRQCKVWLPRGSSRPNSRGNGIITYWLPRVLNSSVNGNSCHSVLVSSTWFWSQGSTCRLKLFPLPIRKPLALLVPPMYVLEEKALIVLHAATGKIIVRRKGALRRDMRRDMLVLVGALLESKYWLWISSVDVSHCTVVCFTLPRFPLLSGILGFV